MVIYRCGRKSVGLASVNKPAVNKQTVVSKLQHSIIQCVEGKKIMFFGCDAGRLYALANR